MFHIRIWQTYKTVKQTQDKHLPNRTNNHKVTVAFSSTALMSMRSLAFSRRTLLFCTEFTHKYQAKSMDNGCHRLDKLEKWEEKFLVV